MQHIERNKQMQHYYLTYNSIQKNEISNIFYKDLQIIEECPNKNIIFSNKKILLIVDCKVVHKERKDLTAVVFINTVS